MIRSSFLPRLLGYWLIINGLAYLAISFTGLLLPQYEEMVSNIAFPALLGEMAFMPVARDQGRQCPEVGRKNTGVSRRWTVTIIVVLPASITLMTEQDRQISEIMRKNDPGCAISSAGECPIRPTSRTSCKRSSTNW